MLNAKSANPPMTNKGIRNFFIVNYSLILVKLIIFQIDENEINKISILEELSKIPDISIEQRVQYLKQQLETGTEASLKLLDLAFDSGFSSKSTLNNVFKREVGMTPSQFLKKSKI